MGCRTEVRVVKGCLLTIHMGKTKAPGMDIGISEECLFTLPAAEMVGCAARLLHAQTLQVKPASK